MKKADFYSKSENKINCELCKIGCVISPKKSGVCRVRENIDGELFTHSYDDVITLGVDPIEKKPLFHVLPGEKALSFATEGCNFSCPWCQNHSISQLGNSKNLKGRPVSPEEIIANAKVTGAKIIAATYTEPTIFYELAYDVATLANENGFINAWVTNGSIEEAPLLKLAPILHAANVDLKTSDTKLGKEWTGLNPDKVMDTIKAMKSLGVWVEITTLIITDFNDNSRDLETIANFIGKMDRNIPWHISRYYPSFKYNSPPTSRSALEMALSIGKKAGLNNIYVGNYHLEGTEDTKCPSCDKTLIKRSGYTIIENLLNENGTCPHCATNIPGIF